MQSTSDYLEQIRHSEVMLQAFFRRMPKGGDLHNHFHGSIYAESYIDHAAENNYWLNVKTLEISEKVPQGITVDWAPIQSLIRQGTFSQLRQELLRKLSIKDFNNDRPSYEHFFDTFLDFFTITKGTSIIEAGFTEIKNRALQEKVSYIETIYEFIPFDKLNLQDFESYQNRLYTEKEACFEELFTLLLESELISDVEEHCKKLEEIHSKLAIDQDNFIMRYQSYCLRFEEALAFFARCMAAFLSVEKSPLIVGVNIVAPEHGLVSMKDNDFHMAIFRFFNQKFPQVEYSIHAGELCIGLVKPEELGKHIRKAVDAGAERIGHGVDISYDAENYELLNHMRKEDVAIEINLSSNEFILGVKGEEHPIRLYQQFKVPMVICTDDAGVLRTNLTEQYIIIAQRYPQISYSEIKKFVLNSILYSFIKEETIKRQLLKQLSNEFNAFEELIHTTFV